MEDKSNYPRLKSKADFGPQFTLRKKGRIMKSKILAEWATLLGITASALKYRIEHWTLEKALTHPVKQRRKK